MRVVKFLFYIFIAMNTGIVNASVNDSEPGDHSTPKMFPSHPQLDSLPTNPNVDIEALLKVDLAKISTEKRHPITQKLSQTFNEGDKLKALTLLRQVDHTVEAAFDTFEKQCLAKLVARITPKLKQQGHIILFGSGSSGRVAIDLAANWNKKFSQYGEVVGIMA